MPGTDRFERIGQVLKSNGADGEVVIGLNGVGAEDISGKEPVFVYFDGLPVPFFLSGIVSRGSSKILARLTDVTSLEDADELAGRALYRVSEDSVEDAGSDFTGWTLRDGEGALVGVIAAMEYIPGNPCIEVDAGKGRVLVPLHEDLVLEVDEEGKVLTMSIPEGLI